MSTTKIEITGYKYRVLQSVMTRAYNTTASCRNRINETSISLVRKLNAGRIRHQWEMENLGVGRIALLDRILNIRECADELLGLDTSYYSEESRLLKAKADILVQGPLRFVEGGLEGEDSEFQEWEEAILELLDKLASEADALRGYLIELAGQAQRVGVEITWWGNPEDDEAKVEHLEEGELLDL